ncbi:LacI family DNA-binding transcriptional regulator [Roseitranquillus sediminis]|uniref:LacI family DNA-binding transcriptional regulator n=1 Tax=Roseitranquillus sediminis TaxID=2809051 RepID=UPI001D0C6CA8|nr:LacI family DNA-binding transcriptional regulator [Roseitranquillus sediminis]MBM9595448.1 LacI family DNA-binding transcriptional regulator [Roseitranquillus sediminis]
MADLARAVGVSKSTVSRAFSRPDMLNPETVDRIAEVAARIGYRPNRAARALSTGRHGNIGMVVPDIANPFFPPLIRAGQVEADRSDFCVFLGNSDEDPEQEDRLVSHFLSQVSGLLLIASRLDEDRIRAYADLCPLVLVNRDVAGIPRILIDSGPAVAEAVRHLHSLGHERIIYVSGPPKSWSEQERRAAAKAEAERLGMSLTVVPVTKPAYETGLELAPPVLDSGATAAVAFDDITAHGLMTGLSHRGVAIPKDFSLVGCDDVLGARTNPPMTTVTTSSEEAGRCAIAMLLALIAGAVPQGTLRTISTRLVLRGTTGPAPQR